MKIFHKKLLEYSNHCQWEKIGCFYFHYVQAKKHHQRYLQDEIDEEEEIETEQIQLLEDENVQEIFEETEEFEEENSSLEDQFEEYIPEEDLDEEQEVQTDENQEEIDEIPPEQIYYETVEEDDDETTEEPIADASEETENENQDETTEEPIADASEETQDENQDEMTEEPISDASEETEDENQDGSNDEEDMELLQPSKIYIDEGDIDTSSLPDGLPVPSEDPPEVVFEIDSDHCLEYIVPPGQINPVIYDYEIAYYYNEDETLLLAEYQQLTTVKFPLYCSKCKEVEDIYQYAYFGDEIFEGSYLCFRNDDMFQTGYKLPTELSRSRDLYTDINIQMSIKHALEIYDGYAELDNYEENTVGYIQQWKKSNFTSSIRVTDAEFEALIQNNVNENILRKKELLMNDEDSSIDFQNYPKWDLDNLNYIYVHPAIEKCHSYEREHFIERLFARQKYTKLEALIAVNNLGWGCYICEESPLTESKLGSQPVVFGLIYLINENGPNQEVTYEALKDPNVMIRKDCIETHDVYNVMSSGFVAGLQYFIEYIPDVISAYANLDDPVDCFEIIKNCAVCKLDECLICFADFTRNSYVNDDDEIEQACFKKWCAPGEKRITNYNGINYCEPCTIENCQSCTNIVIESDLTNTIEIDFLVSEPKFEICMKCQSTYILNHDKTQCLTAYDYFMSQDNEELHPVVETHDKIGNDFNYIIQSMSPEDDLLNPLNFTSEKLEKLKEDQDNEILYFIQQVLTIVNELAQYKEKISVTIWLTKGNHYFFQCKYVTDLESIEDDSNRFDQLCSLPSLQMFQPTTDNINYTIRALRCDDEQAQQLEQTQLNIYWFDDNCVNVEDNIIAKEIMQEDNSEADYTDERPIIHVTSNSFFFNITSYAEFQDVIIDGLDSFAYLHPDDSHNINNEETDSAFTGILGAEEELDIEASIDDSLENQSTDVIQFEIPYWPINKCRLDVNSTNNQGKSKIIQDIINNEDNSTLKEKGYGYLPLQPQEYEDLFPIVINQEYYGIGCQYIGSKINLYNGGANEVFDIINDKTHGMWDQDQEAHSETLFRESIYQDTIDYMSSSNNNDYKIEMNEDSYHYGRSYPFSKRQTLFNLYAFTYSDTYQKVFNDEGELVSNNHTIPTLVLKNVEIRNFLNDYQSLIYVEKDNYIIREGNEQENPSKLILHYGNYKSDINIVIQNSKMVDSSFAHGMIYVPPPNFFNLGSYDIVYRYQNNQKEEYEDIIQMIQELTTNDNRIVISDSVLSNLNYGQVLYGLISQDIEKYQYSVSKGIILSIHDFNGQIEILKNEIHHNMVFIPSAIFTNYPQVEKDDYYPNLEDFIDDTSINEDEEETNKQYWQETFGQALFFTIWKQIHRHLDKRDVDFFNYFNQDIQGESILNEFKSSSSIYISSAKSIIIDNNTFSNNVGLHGGAIHIQTFQDLYHTTRDASDFFGFIMQDMDSNDSPLILIKDNQFIQNMAYFDGNAIFIQDTYNQGIQTAMNLNIINCHFESNYGPNIAYGSAISIIGIEQQGIDSDLDLTTLSTPLSYGIENEQSYNLKPLRIEILDSIFISNYAGIRGAAINLEHVMSSQVFIQNSTFMNHTGAYSFFEEINENPFFKILTMQRHKLNFHVPQIYEDNLDCQNEIGIIGSIECLQPELDQTVTLIDLHVQYPLMKGTIYINNVTNVLIEDCTFKYNDAGPLFYNQQQAGLIKQYGDEQEYQIMRAQVIFIQTNTQKTIVSSCTFELNQLDFFYEYIQDQNYDLYLYFQPNYFKYSQSPLVNIFTDEASEIRSVNFDLTTTAYMYSIQFIDCIFRNQTNTQILGHSDFHNPTGVQNDESTETSYDDRIDVNIVYYAQLIQIYSFNYNVALVFQNNIVLDQLFEGDNSVLISNNYMGAMKIIDNIFVNIGTISMDWGWLPYETARDSQKEFTFNDEEYYTASQENGVLKIADSYIGNDPAAHHYFKGNYFRNIFATNSGIYNIDSQTYDDIRIILESNAYISIYSWSVAILKFEINSATFGDDEAYQGISLMTMNNEKVMNSYAAEIGLYWIFDINFIYQFEISLIARNCLFQDNYSPVISLYGGNLFMDNSTFTSDPLDQEQIDNDYQIAQKLIFDNTQYDLTLSLGDLFLTVISDQTPYDLISMGSGRPYWMETALYDPTYYSIQLGDQIGLSEVFEGFDHSQNNVYDLYMYGQIFNTNFHNFQRFTPISMIFYGAYFGYNRFKNCTFQNIHTKHFMAQEDLGGLVFQDSLFIDIGSKVQYYETENEQDVDIDVFNWFFSEEIPDETEDDIGLDWYKLLEQSQNPGIELNPQYQDEIGSFIKVAAGSYAYIDNCSFQKIVSQQYGLFYVDNDSYLYIYNSFIEEILGISGVGLIMSIQNYEGTIYLEGNIIQKVFSKYGLIYLNVATMTITNTAIIDNYGQIQANGISMISSIVDISDSYIDNSENSLELLDSIIQNQESGFFNMNYFSQVTITRTQFIGLRAYRAALIISAGQSTVFIEESEISNCVAVWELISHHFSNEFTIKDSIITNSSNLGIWDMINNDWLLQNTTFYTNGSAIIDTDNANGVIKECSFIGNNDTFSELPALAIRGSTTILLVEDSDFTALRSTSVGGAIHIEEAKNFTLKYSNFFNNEALNGGAIQMDQVDSGHIENNRFEENKAHDVDEDIHQHSLANQYNHRGGAININCFQNDEIGCNFSLIENSFSYNHADVQGGAISYVSAGFDDIDNSYIENEARLHSDQVSSYATQLKVYSNNTIFTTEPNLEDELIMKQHLDDNDRIGSSSEMQQLNMLNEFHNAPYNLTRFISIPSGQELQFSIDILDEYGELLSHENNAQAEIIWISLDDFRQQFAQPAGSLESDDEMIGFLRFNEVKIVNGTLEFDKLIITQTPGTHSVIQVVISDLEINLIDKSFVTNPLTFLVHSRNCISGERKTNEGTCQICPPNYYLIETQNIVQNCHLCDSNAICFGGNEMAPRDGYSRANTSSDAIIQCPNEYACLEGDLENPLGKCETGYDGFLCGSCEPGYYISTQIECSECPEDGVIMTVYFFYVCWYTFLIYFLAWLSERVMFEHDEQMLNILVMMKVVINHCVIMYYINQIHYDWHDSSWSLIYGETFIESLVTNITQLTCIFNKYIEIQSVEKIMIAFLFVLWIIFSLMIYTCIIGSWHAVKYRAVNIMFVTMWLIYPDVSSAIWSSFACMDYEEGYTRLYTNLEIQCWSGNHLQIVLFLMIPFGLFWIIGYPLLQFYILFKTKKDVLEFGNAYKDLPRFRQINVEKTMKKYGFIYTGYRHQYYFWECINIIRFNAIIFASRYLTKFSSDFQCLICVLFVIIFILVSIYYKPYSSKQVNTYVTFTYTLQMFRMYIGLFYIAGSHSLYMRRNNTPVHVFLAICNLIPSFIFFFIWIRNIRKQILILAYKRSRGLFCFLTCNSINQNKFYNDYIVQEEIDIQKQEESFEKADKKFKKQVENAFDDDVYESSEDSQGNYKDGDQQEHEMMQSLKLIQKFGQMTDQEFDQKINKIMGSNNRDFKKQMIRGMMAQRKISIQLCKNKHKYISKLDGCLEEYNPKIVDAPRFQQSGDPLFDSKNDFQYDKSDSVGIKKQIALAKQKTLQDDLRQHFDSNQRISTRNSKQQSKLVNSSLDNPSPIQFKGYEDGDIQSQEEQKNQINVGEIIIEDQENQNREPQSPEERGTFITFRNKLSSMQDISMQSKNSKNDLINQSNQSNIKFHEISFSEKQQRLKVPQAHENVSFEAQNNKKIQKQNGLNSYLDDNDDTVKEEQIIKETEMIHIQKHMQCDHNNQFCALGRDEYKKIANDTMGSVTFDKLQKDEKAILTQTTLTDKQIDKQIKKKLKNSFEQSTLQQSQQSTLDLKKQEIIRTQELEPIEESFEIPLQFDPNKDEITQKEDDLTLIKTEIRMEEKKREIENKQKQNFQSRIREKHKNALINMTFKHQLQDRVFEQSMQRQNQSLFTEHQKQPEDLEDPPDQQKSSFLNTQPQSVSGILINKAMQNTDEISTKKYKDKLIKQHNKQFSPDKEINERPKRRSEGGSPPQ